MRMAVSLEDGLSLSGDQCMQDTLTVSSIYITQFNQVVALSWDNCQFHLCITQFNSKDNFQPVDREWNCFILCLDVEFHVFHLVYITVFDLLYHSSTGGSRNFGRIIKRQRLWSVVFLSCLTHMDHGDSQFCHCALTTVFTMSMAFTWLYPIMCEKVTCKRSKLYCSITKLNLFTKTVCCSSLISSFTLIVKKIFAVSRRLILIW